eukprot:gene29656-36735_t
MSFLIVLLALVFLMAVAYRGFSVILFAPVAAMLAVLLTDPGLVPPMFTSVFMDKMVAFVKLYFPVFLLGAVFGKVIELSGFSKSIVALVIRLVGRERAMLAIVLVCAVLTYGGVSLFVVVFAVYPFAAEMFRQSNIPKRLIPGTIALGAFTFTMDALPGTPQIQNIIPTAFFQTDTWAAPWLGLIGSVFILAVGLAYLEWRRRQALAKGEGYGAGHSNEPEEFTQQSLPHPLVALLPFEPEGLLARFSSATDFLLPPLPNTLFSRDSSCWIGEGVVLCPMYWPVRRQETLLTAAVYRFHPLFTGKVTTWWGDPDEDHGGATLEGGDVMPLGQGVVMVGMGERTSPQAVSQLARALFKRGAATRVLAAQIPKSRGAMHLDTVFTFCDVDLVTTFPEMVDTIRVHSLRPGEREGSLDVLTDRLYTTAPKSLARRSAQTALYQITHAMLRWMAPFLSFTAEEAWKVFGSSDSIFLETYGSIASADEGLLAKWTRIREIRDVVNKEIETLRAAGQVGSPLQANVTLTAAPEDYALLSSLGDDLKFVFIVSAIELVAGSALQISVTSSSSAKCERCWHYRDDVGQDAAHPTICGRCTSNLHGAGENRAMARRVGWWLLWAVVIVVADQWTKDLILRNYQWGEATHITGFFNIVRAHNTGAAFSFLSNAGGWQRWLFTGIGAMASIFIVWQLYKHPTQKLFCFALASVMGGAIGNVVDRLMHGYVVDFLDFHAMGTHFPAFNVADSAITVGAVCLILDELLRARRER